MAYNQERIGKMKKPFIWLLFFLLFLLIPCMAAANISVSLTPDRTEATLLDSIRIIVNVSGARNDDSQPVLYGMDNFIVRRGGTSSRVEIINGRVSSGIDYTYFVQAKNPGTFKIGPAEIKIKNQTFKSNTEIIKIVKPAQPSNTDRDPLFLKAEISSEKVYVEEQAIYTLKLYRRMRVKDISLNLPELEHFTFKQIGKPREYQSVYHGRSFHVLEVRYLLVPSKEGSYIIGPSKMNMTVIEPRRQSSRNLFNDLFFKDDFFSFSRGYPRTLASEELNLKVNPLPDEGRPADFSGLVGKFKIESKLEPSTLKAGESATLTVLLGGRGNVSRIPGLKMHELKQTKIYDDQPVLKVETDAKGMVGTKTMKWAIVPEKEGTYKIPPLTVSFFDTKTHQYRIIETSPHVFSVLPGEKEQVLISKDHQKKDEAENHAKEEVKELGRDILPIHGSIRELTAGSRLQPGSSLFWVVLLSPFFIYLTLFWSLKTRNKSNDTVVATKAKKAAKNFTKKIRKGDISSSELVLFIRDYLNDRFGLPLGSLTPDEAALILESRGVNLGTAQKMRTTLQRLEDAVYTGKGHEPCDIEKDIPKLIKQIEREIR